jgi:hypothetical protein
MALIFSKLSALLTAGLFDNELVFGQLRCNGILQGIQICRSVRPSLLLLPVLPSLPTSPSPVPIPVSPLSHGS